jgi:hypothetical protein
MPNFGSPNYTILVNLGTLAQVAERGYDVNVLLIFVLAPPFGVLSNPPTGILIPPKRPFPIPPIPPITFPTPFPSLSPFPLWCILEVTNPDTANSDGLVFMVASWEHGGGPPPVPEGTSFPGYSDYPYACISAQAGTTYQQLLGDDIVSLFGESDIDSNISTSPAYTIEYLLISCYFLSDAFKEKVNLPYVLPRERPRFEQG